MRSCSFLHARICGTRLVSLFQDGMQAVLAFFCAKFAPNDGIPPSTRVTDEHFDASEIDGHRRVSAAKASSSFIRTTSMLSMATNPLFAH